MTDRVPARAVATRNCGSVTAARAWQWRRRGNRPRLDRPRRDPARTNIVVEIGGIPTGAAQHAAHVATLAVRLASSPTGNVTGANYVGDGGRIKTAEVREVPQASDR